MRAGYSCWIIAIAFSFAACEEQNQVEVDAGFDAAVERGQGSEARGPLVVNEVMPKPVDGADWLELFNRSDEPIDLCGYFVTDSLDRLDHYHHLGGAPPPQVCEPVILGAGEYLVVVADNDSTAGHAPFKLGVADEAHVVSLRGEAIDSLLFLFPSESEGLSLARQPDGEGTFWLSDASQGMTNPDKGDQ